MSLATGKNALQKLFNWTPRKGWGYELKLIRQKIVNAFRERSEVLEGGVVTEGSSIAAGTFSADMTALRCMLGGRLMQTISALTNTDLLATSGSVGAAIYEDGTAATALSLSTDETAYCTLIVCNSDGAGDADEDDDGAALLVLIVNGDSTDYEDETSHLSSTEIQAALEASDSVHDGVTAWAHVCSFIIDENSASPHMESVAAGADNVALMNRNNVVSEA